MGNSRRSRKGCRRCRALGFCGSPFGEGLAQRAEPVDVDCDPGTRVAGARSIGSHGSDLVQPRTAQPSSRAELGHRHHQQPRQPPPPSVRRSKSILPANLHMLLVVLLAALALQPCSAALIPFENCLPDSYKNGNPTPLQWIGKYVDASLRVINDTQSLTVTMWGNVTGSQYTDPLPPWNDTAYWSDDSKPNGKILRTPNTEKNIITTLHSKINVLTYEPWNDDSDFCNNLTNSARCPLGPVFLSNASRDQLPAISMSNNFTTSYAFTSWSATFLIKYTESEPLNIGCVSATVTPDLGNLATLVRFLPLAILLFVGFATMFAAMFSPWGTTDFFRWTSNYGRDGDLIRLVTPGFGDCLQYIQFAVLTGGLTLNYPGFYQPIVSQMSWSALMFNESFVSHEPGYRSLQDGIYVTNASLGLQGLAQLTGMGNVADIWAGMMVWLLVMIASVFAIGQLVYAGRWIYRRLNNIAEEDLRSKNIPLSIGNVVRIVFNYFLLPIVTLSAFQLVVASSSPAYTVGLAVVTLVLMIGFAAWLLYLITNTKPRAFLFDDLPTVLLYGPLYNTYSDEAATFTMVPLFVAFLRGIAIGAVQPSGIAQVVILAICEVFNMLAIHAVRPFQKPTSMNAYHTVFTIFRLAAVLLMVAFIPALGVTEGPRGWIGYAILVIHACVLGIGFFLNALQTTLEVAVRLSGAGGDSVKGLTRGGLSKIFGLRQLQRREGPSRNSQLSSAAMLVADDASKTGYVMPGGRLRSESAGSGALLSRAHRSSSALDNNSVDISYAAARYMDGASSFTPTTPGEATTFSFLPSPSQGRHGLGPAATIEAAADPYYRPPRRRAPTLDRGNVTPPSAEKRIQRGSWASTDWRRLSQPVPGGLGVDPQDPASISRAVTPGPHAQPTIDFAPRADYSTREVDFYYGVRGQRLNSDAPSRKLGTGPADPTGPMSSAAGWFRTLLGGKTKEKGKGFEVVRSSRMPAAMKARGGDVTDDGAPQGIPVAMSMLRNGPIDSDDEDDAAARKRPSGRPGHVKVGSGETELLDEDGNPRDDQIDRVASIPHVSDQPPTLPGIEPMGSIRLPAGGIRSSRGSRSGKTPAPLKLDLLDEKDPLPAPIIPRKSSRRDSGGALSSSSRDASPYVMVVPPDTSGASGGYVGRHHATQSGSSSRLPFERDDSQKRLSSGSSVEAATDEFGHAGLGRRAGSSASSGASHEDRPTSFGYVHKGSVSHIEVDPDHPRQLNFQGSAAEVVDERR